MNKDTRLVTAMVVAFAAFSAVGCSKNEAATSACGSMGDSASCSACCTSNGASGHKYATGSTCTCLGGGGGAKAAAPATASFAGTYRSTWGPTVFTQSGTAVAAKYPNGTMTCQASGKTLDCDWREAASAGKARLTKEPDGTLKGTWGKGASATDGGPWLFSL